MGTSGEQPRKLLEAAPGERLLQLQWSPDGERIAFLKSSADNAHASVETQGVAGGLAATVLSRGGLRSFCWLSDGRIVFSVEEPPPNDRDMNLWQVAVDGRTGKASGTPERLTNWAGLSLLDLSATADAKRLVFVNSGFQADVYVGELDAKDALGEPQRMTLDERNDFPSAWSPDSQSVYFWSDRNGNSDIFRQRQHARAVEEVVLGPGEQTEARLSPDGSWLLYWDFVQSGGVIRGPMRLLRVPVSRGSPETVLEAHPGSAFRCAVSRPLCVLSERDDAKQELVFTGFSVSAGRVGELVRVAIAPGAVSGWDLSPDGTRLAIVGLDGHRNHVRLLDWERRSSRDFSIGEGNTADGVAFATDSASLLVPSTSVRGSALLRAHLDGRTTVLWSSANAIALPVMAPDGRRVAFAISVHSSNAWMMENF